MFQRYWHLFSGNTPYQTIFGWRGCSCIGLFGSCLKCIRSPAMFGQLQFIGVYQAAKSFDHIWWVALHWRGITWHNSQSFQSKAFKHQTVTNSESWDSNFQLLVKLTLCNWAGLPKWINFKKKEFRSLSLRFPLCKVRGLWPFWRKKVLLTYLHTDGQPWTSLLDV